MVMAAALALIPAVGAARAASDGPPGSADAQVATVALAAMPLGSTQLARGDTGRQNPAGDVVGIRASQALAGRWTSPASRINRVVLVGDSLAQEVTPFLQFLTPGKTFVPKFWGGTAPCDWRDVALEANRNSVVVITFTGNSLTNCMLGSDGEHLADEALVERYRFDIGTLIDAARRAGARVVLVGQPHRAASFEAELEVDGINQVYRDFATAYRFVSFVDAGRAVESPSGEFTERLPCTVFDIDCAADGTTVVRGDGVHFCPVEGENPCSVWSSGAFRFGLVIASGANNPRVFD